jgi:DNA-binding transcriptional LysR family regulator
VRLLLRDRRTVRLTAAGGTYRHEALEILRRNEEAVRLTRRASLGEVGRLRIGFHSSGAVFLPALVQEYHRRFPDVELTLLELRPIRQLEALDQGQLDVVFSSRLPAEWRKEFHHELVYTRACPLRGLCFFTAKAFLGCTTKCSRYAGARATSLRRWSTSLTARPRSCFFRGQRFLAQDRQVPLPDLKQHLFVKKTRRRDQDPIDISLVQSL